MSDKWQAKDIGPRQIKIVEEALAAFSSETNTFTEVTDSGRYDFYSPFGGTNPLAAGLMTEIKEKYLSTITAANRELIAADLHAAVLKMRAARPVIDKRTTPEQRAEREAARLEREATQQAEAAHQSTLEHHNYDLKETSAAIKHALGILFPGTKFSVRSESYSMGCSINVNWTDGPTASSLRGVLDTFQHCDFDGMQDMKTYRKATEWNGHSFDFRGDHVSTRRSESVALLEFCCERFHLETGLAAPAIKVDGAHSYIPNTPDPCGWRFFKPDEEHPAGVMATDPTGHLTASQIVTEMAYSTATEDPQHPLTQETVFRILLGEIKAPRGPETPQQAVSSATVSRNAEKAGIEIRFPAKPEQDVIDRLKGRGYRWSRFSSCWWIKFSQAEWDWACQAFAAESVQEVA